MICKKKCNAKRRNTTKSIEVVHTTINFTNMAEVESAGEVCSSSLTAMDWLPRLSVGGALAGNMGSKLDSSGNKVPGGHIAMRKGPNSPLDTNATYDDTSQNIPPRDGKPPYSYANLITFAINSASRKKMTLSEIYLWICDNFPFYKDAGNGWKVRFTKCLG